MIKPITYRKAVQIIEQYYTNSIPLLVMCDDQELYIVKTIFKKHPPFEDLINEILCNYFLQLWDVKTIEPCLIKIDNDLISDYLINGNSIDNKYINFNFDDHWFYGIQFDDTATEFDKYNLSFKTKHDYNKFHNPLDLIKIGVFDTWIANKDRRCDNPNVIITDLNGKFNFIPIDHTQAFAYQNDYKGMNISLMNGKMDNSILSAPITKKIIKFAGNYIVNNFEENIINCIGNTINNIDDVFKQIPSSFGFSKEGKERVKTILSNKDRNIRISKIIVK